MRWHSEAGHVGWQTECVGVGVGKSYIHVNRAVTETELRIVASKCPLGREAEEVICRALNMEVHHGLEERVNKAVPRLSPCLPVSLSTLTREIKWELYFYNKVYGPPFFMTLYKILSLAPPANMAKIKYWSQI